MPTVTIPPSHFIDSVKKNYANYKVALIREFLQNSVDAGSNNINFNYQDNILTVEDDGCGMTKEILVNALLTMSGTYKRLNPIGSFGAAKEILLFANVNYKIITRQNGISTAVYGKQLEYNFIDEQLDHDGTKITVNLNSEYDDDNEFEANSIDYLEDCTTDAIIKWNDKVIISRSIGNQTKTNDWSNIYVFEKSGTFYQYVYVRIRGVLMFKSYVELTKFKVTVEINVPSTEIFTINRDSFTWKYNKLLSDLIHEINVDKNSFGKEYNKTYRWRGSYKQFLAKHYDESPTIADALNFIKIRSTMPVAMEDLAFEAAKSVSCNPVEIEKITSDLKSIITRDDFSSLQRVDFYIDVQLKNCNKIPANITPGTMSKRMVTIMKLWKHCINLVMIANDFNYGYSLGWLIDTPDIRARYKKRDDINIFMLNSDVDWLRSSTHNNTFFKLLLAACHEVAHINNQYHDENFNSNVQDLIQNCLFYLSKTNNSWWCEYVQAKNEVL